MRIFSLMRQAARFRPVRAALLLAVLLAPSLALASAARVDFAAGEVVAVQADGGRRALARGAEVAAGETVDTGAGRAQLRFSDGALVSLQPGTQFRIDAYEFRGAADGSEKGFFRLIKGAMRTLTGLIGKTHRKAYRLDTAVATIGIRGTEFAVTLDQGVTVAVSEGAVEICNDAGCQQVEAGQSAHAPDARTRPQLAGSGASSPFLAPPQIAPPGFSSGDERPDIKPPAAPPPLVPDPSPPSSPTGGNYGG